MNEKQTSVRSGISYWKAIGTDPIQCVPLDGRVACETAVVGAGITGALVSDMLTQSGVKTVLIDQGDVGAGSTAASTGLLLYEVDKPLIDLIGQVGEVAAVHAYRRGLVAIQELEELASQLPGDCSFIKRTALYLASEATDIEDLRREHECRQFFGFDVNLWSAAALHDFCGMHGHGALYSRGNAEVNPYQLTQSVVRRALGNGLRAFGNTCVVETQEHPDSITLITSSGIVDAKNVVFATGYAAHPILPASAANLLSTYVVTSEPMGAVKRWPDECLIWETAQPYFYLRKTADGRAMMGGEDTPFAQDHRIHELLESKSEKLVSRFQKLFPETLFEPAYTWGGTFAETKDGLPFIGRAPGHEHIYFALGYGGNGITFSMIAARLIRDLLLGRPNSDAAFFRFGR